VYFIVGSLTVLVWLLCGDGNGFYVHRLLLLSAILDMECPVGIGLIITKKKKKKKKYY
jgi:hypothetical protein